MTDDVDIDRETFAMWLFEEDRRLGVIEKTTKWKTLDFADREPYYDEARAYMAMTSDEWPCCVLRRLGYQCDTIRRDVDDIEPHALWSNR